MYRKEIENLALWKSKQNRKPLVIRGARQVGKTWLMKEFGKKYYKNTVYINFENNTQMRTLFSQDIRVDRLITGIEVFAGHTITPENTLLIFDEIQETPRAFSALKYFNEDAPQYQIVCAGSLLGVALHQGTSFPVGKVEFMDLYPLNFNDFLTALGKDQLLTLLDSRDNQIVSAFKQDYILLLKQYYFVGGMPEVVSSFSKHQDYKEVRTIQTRIL